jgi:hypothetical protein
MILSQPVESIAMPHKQPFNPLNLIPSPEAIQKRLTETEALVERLRILLEVAERLRMPPATGDKLPTQNETKGGRTNG